MGQTHDEITQNLAERWCGQVARRDDTRIARRWYRKPVVDGMYRLDAGALLDDFFHCLQAVGVMALLEEVHGTAIQREMLPFVPYLLLYGLKTLFGIESMNALPGLLCSDEALMPLVGCKAPQVRQGVCQRGRTTRPGERMPGPMCPDTLATNVVQWNVRDLEAVFNGVSRALAQAGVLGKRVPGMMEGSDRETPHSDQGCGQVTRTRRIEDKWGRVQEIEVTVYGWKVLLLIEAVTTSPLAVKVVQIHEHEALWTRALVTQSQANLAGHARLHNVVCERDFLAGTDRWWLDQQGRRFVVPAQDTMAVTADARPRAAAGEGVTIGHRVHTVRHGQGHEAWTERLETEVGEIPGLTTYEPYGTEAHGRHHQRHDFEANPINAMVVRQWHGKDYGPGGNTVCLTNASVAKPRQPFDDYDDRSLIEHGCSKEAKQQWDLKHPPQKTARAVRVHVVFTLLLFALATAYRLHGERAALGGEPVGGHAGDASSWSTTGTR
jgi:hypothetical protein